MDSSKMSEILKLLLFSIIISNEVFCEKIWHSNFVNHNRKDREDFTLTKAWIDTTLHENFAGKFWRTINVRNTSFSVSLSDEYLMFLRIEESLIPIQSFLKENYTDATYIEFSNLTSRTDEIACLLMTERGKILWLDAREPYGPYWTWNLRYTTKNIKVAFNPILQLHQVFISSESDLNIYNCDIVAMKFWLAQTLELSSPVGLFDVTTFRGSLFLLVPQQTKEVLKVYLYKKDHFHSFLDIWAANVDQVVTFNLYFKTFFAITGRRAAIYQITEGNVIIKEVPNSNLEGITYWLPTQASDLNRNLVLLGQRVIEHGTHQSLLIDAFTYINDDHFEEHEDIPCEFGEKFNSLACLTSFENSTGIIGASFLSVGENIAVLLAHRYPTNMIRISYNVTPAENPVENEIRLLNETRKKLEEILAEKLQTIQTDNTDTVFSIPTTNVSESPSPASRTSASFNDERPILRININNDLSEQLDGMLDKIQKLKEKMDKIELAENKGNFKKLIVNGTSDIENISFKNINSENLNNENAGRVLNDIVRKNSDNVITGMKTFSDIHVENLFFETFHGIKASDIVFEKPELTINGNITFKEPVAILGNINTEWINDFPSSSIIDITQQIPGTLAFENINVDQLQTGEINKVPSAETWFRNRADSDVFNNETIYFPHNVVVERINGVDFENFLKELCLVNIPTHFAGKITINGDIIVDHSSETQFLDTVKFPENYFFLDRSEGVSITGEKHFLNSLTGTEIRTSDHYINGQKTTDFLSLSTPQDISGRATFENLEVTRILEHEGKTIGDQINKFLPNPTMENTRIIKSNVNFEELEVTGSIIIEDNYNYKNFGEALEDIVYKDEKMPNINSIKEFPEGIAVNKELNITSNAINLIPLDQFVTKDTNQILNIGQLTGNVSIETMEIYQLINGINITKLDQETIKTTGEQFISSFLIFKDDLKANTLEIEEKLNEILVENYATIDGNRVIDNDASFDVIKAKKLIVNGDFEGNIEEIDIEKFVGDRLSYSGNQNVDGNFSLENSQVEFVTCDVKSVYCENFFDKKYLMEKLMNKISTGEMRVKSLIVSDDLDIEKLNGKPLKESEDLRQESIEINGDVYFPNLQTKKLSEVSFKSMMENIVFKNESSFTIRGTKIFQKGFVVDKLIETEKLNDVPIENLLTKENKQIINAPIEIHGNVTFKSDLNISETLNDISIEDMKNYFEMKNATYIRKGDILFDRMAHIYNLEIIGNLNDRSVENVLKNMALTTKNLSFSEEIEFANTVTIDGNLAIENHLNDINLSEINENIVYLNKTIENNVESFVTFTSPNIFAHDLVVETDLMTKSLAGIDLENLMNDSVFVNRGFMPGFYHFENVTIHEKLLSDFINDIAMNETIPLGTNQSIPQHSIGNAVFLNDVPVGHLVNQKNLPKEYSQSVLSNEEQEIFSELVFLNNTLVTKSLEVAGLLNGNPFEKVVTTDTNQNLSAVYNFPAKINANSNIYVSGFVNGINMSSWEDGGVKMISSDTQIIEAPWHCYGNITFRKMLEGENNIYNFDILRSIDQIEERKKIKNALETQYEVDREAICKDINIFEKKLEKQIYRFEMLEDALLLDYPFNIGKVYFFMAEKPTLMINAVDSCKTEIFVFKTDLFSKIAEAEMGEIEHIVSTDDEIFTYFIVKSKPNPKCEIQGTNVWRFKNRTVEILQAIENQQQLQESRVPSTFYGLNKHGVTEFVINSKSVVPVYQYRKWKFHEVNTAFVPRGLGTGLAIRTGEKLIKLLRDNPGEENEIGFGDVSFRGDVEEEENSVFPGRNNSKLIVLEVGPENMRKRLLAVVFHEETVVGRNLDVIRIYEDYRNKKVFQKIFSFNPTYLETMNFGNGETLLLVLENEEILQVYQYKGIEGFQHRFTAEVRGTRIFKMLLPLESSEPVEVICFIYGNLIRVIKPVMVGKRMNEKIEC